ncbi:MAG: GGDEF domain-containing protein [Proteobacteria bacterium]|nr:MAG: GGDEF domain-containing protein [Pseudomonadota bacterium]
MLTDRDTPLATTAQAAAPPEGGSACLVSIYGPELGRRWPLDRDELVIGRDPGCEVALPIDTVSRRHCAVRVRGGAVFVADLGSTNGTALNDDALAAQQELALRSGDRIRVGSAVLKYLRGDDVESLYHEEIYRTMIADGLTGAANRRFLDEFLEREMARCRRHRRPLALVLFDLDHFKKVNDGFGHLTGDAVLREVAAIARGQVRREDCFARFGGEEFAIVLTETDAAAARLFAEKLRGTIEVYDFYAGSERIPVTVSAGVAAMTLEMRDASEFVAAADARLYEAKTAGRNRTAG